MHATTPRWERAATLTWSVPAAVVGGLGVAVMLAVLALGLTGSLDSLLQDTTPVKGLALALVPTLALALATLTGMITGTTVVASLVRDSLAGHRGRYAAGWARAWRTLPKVLALGAVGVPAVVLGVVLWPALSVAVLARAAWRLRSPESRADTESSPGAGLWLAFPFAVALAVLAALPTTWSHLVTGATLRDAVRAAVTATLRARLGALAVVGVLGLVSWGLGALGLSRTAAPGASTGEFATGTAVLGVTAALLLAVAGSLLGILAHTRSTAPPARPGPERISPAAAFGRFWRPNRLAATASTLVVALLAPILAGAVGAAASAWVEESETDFVVNTLTDSTTIPATACVDAAPCSVRAALSRAATAAAVGDPAVVRFAVEGRIDLVATLRVGSGVTINGNDAITLNGQRARRVLETFAASRDEGPRVTFTVNGVDLSSASPRASRLWASRAPASRR
ncbi:hypothetical protein [Nocardioides aurantiacus]|uniref:Uncharacterized protein n=1 Tax=Nocardioides aurantiacus TaxID=86796 RepID=A0A3N2CZK8_9ACTN|nr:hypothetical protein [Nocardioides aurantiacus]ROR92962.1 hypothetical protein EDD33_3867 [Nocardioides aurantiacus]